MEKLRIGVVYQSGGGHTRVLAEAVARGCERVQDALVDLIEIVGKDVVAVRWRNDEIFAQLDAAALCPFNRQI